jgi:hypothetical protein
MKRYPQCAAFAVAVALSIAACGSSGQSADPATSEVATTTSDVTDPVYPTPTTDPGGVDPATGAAGSGGSAAAADWRGKMTVTYEDATNPETQAGKDLMQGSHLLEDLADSINQLLKLPDDITLKGAECGEENAFWTGADQTVTMCYEYADWALKTFTNAGDPDPAQSALGLLTATFYHETGHMAISIYNLPTTGREEDVADQAAAFMLLQPGDDGHVDPAARADIMDYARGFKQDSEDRGPDVPDWLLADPHTLDKSRMYNFECWIYGADPTGNADIVSDGLLPQDRADRCQDEFEKLNRAWGTLLAPYLK